jgi:hypothetical protein
MTQQQQKRRQRYAAGETTLRTIDAELVAFTKLPIAELRKAWANRFGDTSPAISSRDVLLHFLAWRIQADLLGGLDPVTERKLRDIAKALERDGDYEPKIRRDLSPGIVLTREWKGVIHKVTVTADGFQYLGRRYGSLSDIARMITGTRWSGPRFFGLERKEQRQPRIQQQRATSFSVVGEAS